MIAIEEEKIINSIRSLGDQILENSYLVELFVKEMVISFYIKGTRLAYARIFLKPLFLRFSFQTLSRLKILKR